MSLSEFSYLAIINIGKKERKSKPLRFCTRFSVNDVSGTTLFGIFLRVRWPVFDATSCLSTFTSDRDLRSPRDTRSCGQGRPACTQRKTGPRRAHKKLYGPKRFLFTTAAVNVHGVTYMEGSRFARHER